MAYLDQPIVQQYLEQTKGRIDTIDVALDEGAASYVLSRLTQYDVSGWIDEPTTPTIVREIMAMRYAGIYYSRQFGEDVSDMNTWGGWLLKQVEALLTAITTGTIDIPGVTPVTNSRGPLFFPNDQCEFDDMGNEIKFKMGSVF